MVEIRIQYYMQLYNLTALVGPARTYTGSPPSPINTRMDLLKIDISTFCL